MLTPAIKLPGVVKVSFCWNADRQAPICPIGGAYFHHPDCTVSCRPVCNSCSSLLLTASSINCTRVYLKEESPQADAGLWPPMDLGSKVSAPSPECRSALSERLVTSLPRCLEQQRAGADLRPTAVAVICTQNDPVSAQNVNTPD